MRLARLSLPLSVALLLGCQQSSQLTNQQRGIQSQIVGDRLNEWVRFVNNGEVDELIAMYSPDDDLTMVFPDGRRGFGAEATQSLTDFYANLDYINLGPQNPNVDVLDANTAVVTFRFSVDAILLDTSRDPFAGQATFVWTKDSADGQWKIHTQHLSRNPM